MRTGGADATWGWLPPGDSYVLNPNGLLTFFAKVPVVYPNILADEGARRRTIWNRFEPDPLGRGVLNSAEFDDF